MKALVQRVIVKSKAKSLNENYTHVINVIYVSHGILIFVSCLNIWVACVVGTRVYKVRVGVVRQARDTSG